MQLWQLVLLVVLGISGGVWLVHLSGGSRVATIADYAQAIIRFQLDFPSVTPSKVIITKSGNAAFLNIGQEGVGLLHAIGDGFLTRILSANDIVSATRNDLTLTLKLNDFTFRGDTYTFNDQQTTSAVLVLLSALKESIHA